MLIVIAGQLFILLRAYKADHERRKKQSTIEFSTQIRQNANEYLDKIDKKYGDKPIDTTDMDSDLETYVRNFLFSLENLSVGVNTEVYDLVIVDRLNGTYLQEIYRRSLSFIQHQRQKRGSNTLYSEFEVLSHKISERRRSSSNEGSIKYS